MGHSLFIIKLREGRRKRGVGEKKKERGKFMQNRNITYLHGSLKRTNKTRFHDIFSCHDHFNQLYDFYSIMANIMIIFN